MTDVVDRETTFAQRYRLDPPPQLMAVGEVSRDLRVGLWNQLYRLLKKNTSCETIHFMERWEERWVLSARAESFALSFLTMFCRIPEDEADGMDRGPFSAKSRLKEVMLEGEFPKPIALIEWAVNEPLLCDDNEGAVLAMARLFEKLRAPYYLDMSARPYRIFLRASKEAGDAVLESEARLKEMGGYEGALSELRQANEDIRQGNYRAAITHSIHAVESVARVLSPGTKTLEPALKELEKQGLLKHKNLASAFRHLYKFTNDEQGMRHPLLEKGDADVGLAEALFFRTACAGFVDYLAAKAREVGVDGKD